MMISFLAEQYQWEPYGQGAESRVYYLHPIAQRGPPFIVKSVKDDKMVSDLDARDHAELAKCPHLVPILQTFRVEALKTHYYVMPGFEQYHTGCRDLHDYVYKYFVWKDETVLLILYQLCVGVAYLHARGYVHTDIKEENVFLYQGGKEGGNSMPIARLGDFGYMVRTGTRIKKPRGTKGYMAPELIAKTEAGYQPAMDVYSLGMMLAHMYRHRGHGVAWFPPCMPTPLANLARACLDPDPRERPTIETCRDVMDAVLKKGVPRHES